MVMETKLSILDALDKNVNGLHLRKLTTVVDGSFPNIRRFVNVLAAEGVVKTEPQGNLLNITLTDSLQTLAYLKFVHTSRFTLTVSSKIQTAIVSFLAQLPTKPLIATVIPSSQGSYDLLLVFQSLDRPEEYKSLLTKLTPHQNVQLNPLLFDYNTFEHAFADGTNSFIRRLRSTGIVVVGVEHYYTLLWRLTR